MEISDCVSLFSFYVPGVWNRQDKVLQPLDVQLICIEAVDTNYKHTFATCDVTIAQSIGGVESVKKVRGNQVPRPLIEEYIVKQKKNEKNRLKKLLQRMDDEQLMQHSKFK